MWKRSTSLLLIGILAVSILGAYYHFVYSPKKQEEERKKSLMEYAGFTDEEAIEFDKNFKNYAPYNQTLLDFAKFLKEYPLTTSKIYELTNSFAKTVNSLKNAEPIISGIPTGDQKARDFVLKYPPLVLDDGINATDAQLMKYHFDLPILTDAVITSIPSQDIRLSILPTLYPLIKNQTIPEEKASSFIIKHKELALDDGINATDIELMKYYVHLPGIVDKVIEKVKPDDRLFALGELTLYISKPLTQEQAYHLIEKCYPDLFEASKKEGMPVVFGDIDGDYVNNYDEIFKYGTDPLFGIGNFTWTPTKVINDKVYEGSVFVRAKSLRGILPSELYWIPINYTQFPLEVQLRAFPNETVRRFDLIPVNENLIESTINMTDIKGGREYLIPLNILDKAGSINREIKTPYIREFENLGKQLYEKGVKIGILYGLIAEQFEWDNPLKLGLPYEPLLGYYLLNSTEDLMVIEKHMDWMSGHGINFVLFLWPERVMREGNIRERVYKEAISTLEIFETGGMKFGISYGFEGEPPFNMSDPQRVQSFKEDLSYLAENYFGHPACFKINGKPFFWIWGTPAMGGDFIGALKEVYEFMKENYGIQLYVVSDHAGPEVDENWGGSGGEGTPYIPVKDWVPLFFDAMLTGAWISPHYREYAGNGSWEDYLENGFKYWYDFSLRNGLDFIPFAIPGASAKYCSWHPPEMREADPGNVPRTIELWKKRIEMAISYSNTFGIMVGDFNNVFENAHIEPTVQEGFEYLKAMKDVLSECYELGT